MSTNLLRHGPKWKLANYRLELYNDEVGVIKQSGPSVKKTNTDIGISIWNMLNVICFFLFHASNHLSLTSQ